jgi:hypothetical protein
MGVSGELGGSIPSAMKRRTFLHGSVPVEREISKPGSLVLRDGETPFKSMGAGGSEISRRVVQRQDA